MEEESAFGHSFFGVSRLLRDDRLQRARVALPTAAGGGSPEALTRPDLDGDGESESEAKTHGPPRLPFFFNLTPLLMSTGTSDGSVEEHALHPGAPSALQARRQVGATRKVRNAF